MTIGGNIQEKLRDMYAVRHEPESLHLLADIYWRCSLLVAITIVAGALLWGVWNLSAILNDLSHTNASAQLPPPVLDRTELERVLQIYDTKQATFDAYKTAPAISIPDPR